MKMNAYLLKFSKFGAILLVVAALMLPAGFLPVAAQGGDEPIAYGDNKLGEITAPEGKGYLFSGQQGDEIEAEAFGFNGFVPVVSLAEAPSRNVIASNLNAEAVATAELTATLPADGDYLIIVQGANGMSGQFALSLSKLSFSVPEDAPTLELNAPPVTATLDSPDTPLYFRFRTSPKNPVELTVQPIHPDFNPIINVYTEDGELLLSVTNSLLMGNTFHFKTSLSILVVVIELGDFPPPASVALQLINYQPIVPFEVFPDETPPSDSTDSDSPPPATSVPGATDVPATPTLFPTETGPTDTPVPGATQAPPTATNVPPTSPPPTSPPPTATPTPSYTPTTQAAQEAPPDARFNSPLEIPLDTTASVTEFVSYPGGDTEDRIRWSVTGMNPNSSLSGGQAQVTLAFSCFGEGTQHIQFFVSGQTYSCGQSYQTNVTFDSNTGSVTITATGGTGTYVQWVVTGTATRTN